MTNQRFALLLSATLLLAALLAAAAHAYWPIDAALPLTAGMIFWLVLLSVAIFYLGKRTANASNKHLFGNIFMGATMIKMFTCGGLIAAFVVLAKPDNNMFVVPFFTSYFIFTLLEIIALVALAGGDETPAKPETT